MGKAGNAIKVVLKVVLWLAISLALLFIMVIGLAQIPAIQNRIIGKVTSVVEQKANTQFHIDRVSISYTGAVVIKNLYLEDFQKDTLLYVGSAKLRISLIGLICSRISVDYLSLGDTYLNINRPLTDSLYNFNFLLSAFASTTSKDSAYSNKESKWAFAANRVELKNIRLHFNDEFGGVKLLINLQRLNLNVDKLDLVNSIYSVDNLTVENLVASILTSESAKAPTKSAARVLPLISVRKIQISKSAITYGDSVRRLNLAALVYRVEVLRGTVDLNKQTILVDKVSLAQSSISVNTSKRQSQPDSTKLPSNVLTRNSNWEVAVRHVELEDNTAAYNVANSPIVINGFDVNHLNYSHLNVSASNFFYSSQLTRVTVNKFSAADKLGLSIQQLETDFSMDRHSITANRLKVRTTSSSIDADIRIQFSSFQSLRDSLQFIILDLDLRKVSIANADIAYFGNRLANQPFFRDKASITTITGKLNGAINSLTGKKLVAKTGASTVIKTDFVIAGLPNMQAANFRISNLSVVSGKDDIEMLAGSFIPKSIDLPENISTQIVFNGMLQSFEAAVNLSSSFGSATLVASIADNENFSCRTSIVRFNLGRLLRDTAMLGPLSLVAEVNGTGLDINTVSASVKASVTELFLNGYNYRNLVLNGDVSGKEFAGLIALNDKNAAFDFDGKVNLTPNRERYKFNLNLKGANLQKLNITTDDIRVALAVSADLKGDNLNALSGTAGVSNIILAQGENIFRLDSLLFASITQSGKSELNFSSALVGVKYSGSLSPVNLIAELGAFVNSYFPFSNSTQLAAGREPSNFNLEIRLHNHPILSQVLLPNLKEFEPGVITGSFDSEKSELKLHATMNRIVYGLTEINDFVLDITSNYSELAYNVSSSAVSNARVRLENLRIGGNLSNGIIMANISSVDQDSKKKIELHSSITRENERYRIALFPKDFYLMHNQWNIAADNYIEFGKTGVLIHNFFMESASSKINVTSVSSKPNDDISIEVINFNLGNISRVIEKDTSLFKGVLDGTVLLKRVNASYGLIANAHITNLIIREVPIGNLTAKASNPTPGRFDVDVNLSGPENSITASGYFIAKDGSSSINIKTDIRSLSMKTLEAFSMGQITEASGVVSGKLAAIGAIAAPEITGNLVFSNAFIKPAFLNNRLELKHETIQFTPSGIYFKSFTILDSHEHTAIIDGWVKMEKYKNLVFALRVNTKDFQLFNTTAQDSRAFFGRMIIDSRIDINGPMSLPVINARVKVKDGSNFTFAVPEKRLTTDRGEDVVAFDGLLKMNPILAQSSNITSQKKGYTGFDLSTIIEIDRQATLRLLLDPSSSDSLVVRGESALSFSIDRSGKMSLTGAYHLNDGSYLVSLESIVKRRFDIIPGSTIVWNGDPLDAEISINAKYAVKAAPYDLLAAQMTTLTDMESSAYKQRYPFWVMLKLRGAILHPAIGFEIQLPPEEMGILGGAVSHKLSMLNEDESALNKQVFALLVMGRFIQENPLQTETNGATSVVRATVGKLLSAQLNQLGSRVIPGVELNVDIQSFEDYQSGEPEGRTQVELGVKKDLFNNRLSIQVGGIVDVEGESVKQNSASDITGDVNVEYKLTKDGRYRLKGFRQNKYEGALEGQLVETGVGVAFVRDFNRWKNLFRRQQAQRDSTGVRKQNREKR
ncbi:MAG: translocation/assembly module TamB [Bacteroidales bacterium]|nr:translocation/assembly module TamB [Bacteroidales bacterium]MBN2749902.1 translocation/assembly module TamB [Bacteroidales bacterium]